jgi:hypothetical protein
MIDWEVIDVVVVELLVGPAGPNVYPNAVYDTAPGDTIELEANVPSWNVSLPSSGTNTYQFPIDSHATPRTIAWGDTTPPTVPPCAPPMILPPAGWQVQNPVNGDFGDSYTYGFNNNGPGESYTWFEDAVGLKLWGRSG